MNDLDGLVSNPYSDEDEFEEELGDTGDEKAHARDTQDSKEASDDSELDKEPAEEEEVGEAEEALGGSLAGLLSLGTDSTGDAGNDPPESATETEEPNLQLPEKKQTTFDMKELHEAKLFLARYQVATKDMSDVEVIEKTRRIQGHKKTAVQVLSRGRVLDGLERLLSYVPKGFVGEFMTESDIGIARARSLGFEVLHCEEASQDSPTGKGDSLVRFGDQILMIIPEDQYIAMQVAKDERHVRNRGGRNLGKLAKEETKEFLSPVSPM